MKTRKVVILFSALLLCVGNVSAKGNFWKAVGNGLRKVAQAAGAALLQEACVQNGYSRDDAAEMVKNTYEFVGLDTKNAELGMNWNNAEDKFARENYAKDVIFDVVGEATGRQDVVNKFKTMTDAQLTYLSDKTHAMTAEEHQAALEKRTRTYAYLFYDTYQEGKERKAAYLAEKMKISDQLMATGMYSNSLSAEEVAGSIIAINNSKDFTPEEKEEMLRSYGFGMEPKEIIAMADEAMSYDENNAEELQRLAEEQARKEAEERARREAEEQARREAEARRVAIEKVEAAKVNEYPFDAIKLSANQKQELDSIAEILQKYDDVQLQIIGHTCSIGYKKANQHVGLRRAELCKEYLVKQGVAEERIICESKGETSPLVANDTPQHRMQNRRVEFIVIQ